MTKTPIPTENSKTKGQHKHFTKNFDYTTIADQLKMVSWSNNSDPNVVVKSGSQDINLESMNAIISVVLYLSRLFES